MRLPTRLIASILFFLLLFYMRLFRPWQLRWGATDGEIKRSMPGDEIVDRPSFNATRAVTINAPAENIFPWIAQMGVTRAGWYSYDLLDNLAKPSAENVLAEYQDVQLGDVIPMSPDGKQGMRVNNFSVNEWMVWTDNIGDTSWVWGIYSEGEAFSRLITRVRVKYRWFSPAVAFNILIELFDIVMMRKCMLGIKRRAEAMPLTDSLAG